MILLANRTQLDIEIYGSRGLTFKVLVPPGKDARELVIDDIRDTLQACMEFEILEIFNKYEQKILENIKFNIRKGFDGMEFYDMDYDLFHCIYDELAENQPYFEDIAEELFNMELASQYILIKKEIFNYENDNTKD